MILQLLLLGIIIVASPLMPPILVPLSYSYTGVLIAQSMNLRILSIVSVGAAVLADIIIWKLQNYIIERMTIYEKVESKDFFSRAINWMNSFFKDSKRIGRISLKREKYLEKRTGRILTFLFAIVCYMPVLPDIIGTRILYKKIKFPYFVLAAIIGKSVTHIPFILLGKTLVQLLHIKIG